jgi:DNA polymerase III delta prime subunit
LLDQNTAWISKWKPSTIDGYVFSNDQHQQIVSEWINNGSIGSNAIFYGPPGTGKTTIVEILIHKIIKTQSDLFRMKSRSVAEIDELKQWIGKKPNRSSHNIVYIEEIDKLSKQAQVTLKDGMLEKFTDTCIFLCCTNHPRKLDPALYSRFTYKFNLDSFDKESLEKKIIEILAAEQAEYDSQQLKDFVELNYQKGLRDILNLLQISYITNNKKIIFSDLIGRTETEDNIIALMLTIIKTVLKLNDSRQKKQCLLYPVNSVIAQDYTNLVTLLHNNWDIDYDQIFEQLIENIDLYPAKNIIARYHETYDDKKYVHLHLIACLYETLEACCKAQL